MHPATTPPSHANTAPNDLADLGQSRTAAVEKSVDAIAPRSEWAMSPTDPLAVQAQSMAAARPNDRLRASVSSSFAKSAAAVAAGAARPWTGEAGRTAPPEPVF